MTKVLILGGSGHLGSALRASAPEAMQVTPAYASSAVPGGVAFRLQDAEALPEAEVVIGAFPLARLLQDRSDAEIDEAVRAYVARCGGARIVQLSTDAVFSGAAGDYDEAAPADPVTAYGRAQAAVDRALPRHAPDCLIVRTSFIFGWAGGRFDKRLARFAAGEDRTAAQNWAANIYRGPTEVNFLAEAIWRAVARRTDGLVNIAGPRLSIYEFFTQALAQIGEFEWPSRYEETDAAVARDTSLRTLRMETELGLSAREVWGWYRHILRRRRGR